MKIILEIDIPKRMIDANETVYIKAIKPILLNRATKQCSKCGDSFEQTSRRRTLFCSERCRVQNSMRAYRARKKEAK